MEYVTRDNHFLAQWYLKNWSTDGKRIFAYRTLVSHQKVPLWEPRSITKSAYVRDLYTTFDNGQEVDEFERWHTAEFEEPAIESVEKVIRDAPLDPKDWERLALFFASQDVRTPASFMLFMQRCDESLPQIMEKTVREALQELEEAKRQGRQPKSVPQSNLFSDHFKVAVERFDPSTGQTGGMIRAEVLAGRGLWISNMGRQLTDTAKILKQHQWSILEPKDGGEWFTSDHPVLRLNYYVDGRYDFRGGWNNPDTELMLPLSPKHLLYTRVGAHNPERITCSWDKTYLIQKFLAERAYRWIFATKPTERIPLIHPRLADDAQFKAEEEAWRRFHEDQRKAESEK